MMHTIYKSTIFIFLLLLISINDVLAANRYALVIGNAEYPFEQLRNPSNDAKDIALVLEKYGFDVDLKTNATLSQLKQSLDVFQNNLQSSQGIGLIYFAGHGVQLQTENFLLPINVSTTSAEELKRTALSLNDVVNTLDKAQNKLNLVILDACRNNPFKTGSLSGISRGLQVEAEKEKDGLAPVAISVSSGTVFWYATRPGEVALDGSGRNSPFTASLIDALNKHAVPAPSIISKVALQMRDLKIYQQPWQEGIWLEDFHFDQTSKTKSTPMQLTHTNAESKALNNLLRDYIEVCKTSKRKCEELAAAQKMIKQPSEVDGFDAWLGKWQCTWANFEAKGTNIVEIYKFENNILYGTSNPTSTCPQNFKFSIDVTRKPLKYMIHQSYSGGRLGCGGSTRITINQYNMSKAQSVFTSSFGGSLPHGFRLADGEETCIKIY